MILNGGHGPKKTENETDNPENNSVEHGITVRKPSCDVTTNHGKDTSIGKGQQIGPKAPDRLAPCREEPGLLEHIISRERKADHRNPTDENRPNTPWQVCSVPLIVGQG
jgi:hypothetical protein